jgi:hypothetical protein
MLKASLTIAPMTAAIASQRALWLDDTILNHKALKTLDSLDTVRTLLRIRSKGLSLLHDRVQWEDCFADVQIGLASIHSELPAFIEKARWTTAPSTPVTIKILNREHTYHLTRILTLIHTTLPSCFKALDVLIKSASIPDAWLVRQAALKIQVENETNGMIEFLGALVRQWHQSDHAWIRIRKLHHDAALLKQEMQVALLEGLLKHPKNSRAKSFETSIQSLQDRSVRLSMVIAATKTPVAHKRIADQKLATERLIVELWRVLAEAKEEIELAAEATVKYRAQVRESSQTCDVM